MLLEKVLDRFSGDGLVRGVVVRSNRYAFSFRRGIDELNCYDFLFLLVLYGFE